MKIGFDLDGIFIDTPPFVPKKIIEWLYRGHDHKLFYRFPSKPEQWLRQIAHVSLLRPVIINNAQYIKTARIKNSDTYYLISSRFGFLKKATEEIIKLYKLASLFDGMYFNFDDKQPHVFKDHMLKELKIDRYVDDDLLLLQFLAKENPTTKFYWFNKKEKKLLAKNLFAIIELSDVLRKY